MKKTHAHQITLKNIHAKAQKIYTSEIFLKNNLSGSRIPHPPHNVSNVPFLRTPDQIEITKVFW